MKKKLKKLIKPAICLRPDAPTDKINAKSVRRIIAILGYGLTNGIGTQKPGKFCVEAAVAYGMGYDHNDSPDCVSEAVADFKYRLNDEDWSSNFTRAKGLRAIAIAQLGTNGGKEKSSVYVNEKTFNLAIAQVLARRGVLALAVLYARRPNMKLKKDIDILENLIYDMFNAVVMNDDISCSSPYNLLEDTLPSNRYLQRLMGRRGLSLNAYLCLLADIGTEALVALKTPGSKYLYLLKQKNKKNKK